VKLDGFRADEVIRVTAVHRANITRKDYAPLLTKLLPVRGWMSVDHIVAQFSAFESEINPRWDGSIA
jgi:hypothetical protein